MRLILSYLAAMQIRLAMLDLARSELLAQQSEEAFASCETRLNLAQALANRAGLVPVDAGHRCHLSRRL